MSIRGEKFLEVSRARQFTITDHAIVRMAQHTGLTATRSLASSLFRRSRQVRPENLFDLGYRPAYFRRLHAGTRSWYFRFHLFGLELIAVVGEGNHEGEYVWLTTYGPTEQQELLRIVDPPVGVTAAA